MGYVAFGEINQRSGNADSKFQRTYTRTFQVVTDDPLAGPFYAGSHPLLPKLYSPHNEDPFAFCVNIRPQSTESDTVWHVACDYAYTVDGFGASNTGVPAIDSQNQGIPPEERNENPLLRPRDYSFATQSAKQVTVYRGRLNGAANLIDIKNLAGDPFNPPLSIDEPLAVITVGLNSLTPPGANWVSAFGKLNLNQIVLGPWTLPPGTGRNRGCSSQRAVEGGLSYWRWSITFEVRDTWAEILLEQGLRELNDNSEYPTQIIDPVSLQAVGAPVPLGLDGKALKKGDPFVFGVWDYIPRVAFPSPL